MYVYVRQVNFTTNPRFEILKLQNFAQMNSSGSRVEKNAHTHSVKMQRIFLRRILGDEIFSSDVIKREGHCQSRESCVSPPSFSDQFYLNFCDVIRYFEQDNRDNAVSVHFLPSIY